MCNDHVSRFLAVHDDFFIGEAQDIIEIFHGIPGVTEGMGSAHGGNRGPFRGRSTTTRLRPRRRHKDQRR